MKSQFSTSEFIKRERRTIVQSDDDDVAVKRVFNFGIHKRWKGPPQVFQLIKQIKLSRRQRCRNLRHTPMNLENLKDTISMSVSWRQSNWTWATWARYPRTQLNIFPRVWSCNCWYPRGDTVMFEDKRSLAPVGGRDRRVVGDTVSHNRLCLKKREVLHLLVAGRARLWAGARTQTIVPSLGAGGTS